MADQFNTPAAKQSMRQMYLTNAAFGSSSLDQVPTNELMALLAMLSAVGTQAGSYGSQAPSAAQFLQDQLTGTTDKGVPNWVTTALGTQGQRGKGGSWTGSSEGTLPSYYFGTTMGGQGGMGGGGAGMDFMQLFQNFGDAFKTYMNKNAQQNPAKTLFQQATGATSINQPPVTNTPMPQAAAPAAAASTITPNTAATNAALAPVPPPLPANNPWSYGGPPSSVVNQAIQSAPVLQTPVFNAQNAAAGYRPGYGPGAMPSAANTGAITPVPALSSAGAPRATPATVGDFMNTTSTGTTGPTQSLGTYGGGGLLGGMSQPQQQAFMGGISGIGSGLAQMFTPVPHQIPQFGPMPPLPNFITPTMSAGY